MSTGRRLKAKVLERPIDGSFALPGGEFCLKRRIREDRDRKPRKPSSEQ